MFRNHAYPTKRWRHLSKFRFQSIATHVRVWCALNCETNVYEGSVYCTHTSVRPFLQTWPKKKWQSSSLVTTVVCARLVLPVTVHLALCSPRVVCAAKSPTEQSVGTSKRCGLTISRRDLRHCRDTLFGALPLEKKPPESVSRNCFSTVLGDVSLNELDTTSASVVIVSQKGTAKSGACGSISLNTGLTSSRDSED